MDSSGSSILSLCGSGAGSPPCARGSRASQSMTDDGDVRAPLLAGENGGAREQSCSRKSVSSLHRQQWPLVFTGTEVWFRRVPIAIARVSLSGCAHVCADSFSAMQPRTSVRSSVRSHHATPAWAVTPLVAVSLGALRKCIRRVTNRTHVHQHGSATPDGAHHYHAIRASSVASLVQLRAHGSRTAYVSCAMSAVQCQLCNANHAMSAVQCQLCYFSYPCGTETCVAFACGTETCVALACGTETCVAFKHIPAGPPNSREC